jgi:hypothetical protein
VGVAPVSVAVGVNVAVVVAGGVPDGVASLVVVAVDVGVAVAPPSVVAVAVGVGMVLSHALKTNGRYCFIIPSGLVWAAVLWIAPIVVRSPSNRARMKIGFRDCIDVCKGCALVL